MNRLRRSHCYVEEIVVTRARFERATPSFGGSKENGSKVLILLFSSKSPSPLNHAIPCHAVPLRMPTASAVVTSLQR